MATIDEPATGYPDPAYRSATAARLAAIRGETLRVWEHLYRIAGLRLIPRDARVPFEREPPRAGNGSMVVFRTPSAAAVDSAYAAGLAANEIAESADNCRLLTLSTMCASISHRQAPS